MLKFIVFLVLKILMNIRLCLMVLKLANIWHCCSQKMYFRLHSNSILTCQNLPHDAYKLLAVPSPIGGVLVVGANTIHYHSQVYSICFPLLLFFWGFHWLMYCCSLRKFIYMLNNILVSRFMQSASCALALNNYAVSLDSRSWIYPLFLPPHYKLVKIFVVGL